MRHWLLSLLLTGREYWYRAPNPPPRPPYVIQSALDPLPPHVVRFARATREIELGASAEALFAALPPRTRSKIARAQHEGLQVEQDTGADALARFCHEHNEIMLPRGAPAADLPRLLALGRHADLSVTRVTLDTDRRHASTHLLLRSAERMRFLFGMSSHYEQPETAVRAAMARAHLAHFWHDIQLSKQLNCSHFDLGGWYTGTKNRKLLDINLFKSYLGGKVVHRPVAVVFA